MKRSTKKIVYAAVIAALYVVFTEISSLMGLASFPIQLRLSEALTILPLFTPSAVGGLFIGCLISNLLTGCHILDVIFGSIATLIGAFLCLLISKHVKKESLRMILGPLPAILSNVAVIPFILSYVYGFEGSLFFFMITVLAGEVLSAGVLGILLYKLLKKYEGQIFR